MTHLPLSEQTPGPKDDVITGLPDCAPLADLQLILPTLTLMPLAPMSTGSSLQVHTTCSPF